ncbi:MAG: methyltransferase domain-containing protein [Thermomicrobiales bacterium]|nr:methyltransferase domain-containing protein [Thermomicrobiales bacterium]
MGSINRTAAEKPVPPPRQIPPAGALSAADQAALDLLRLEPGHQVLDLGCGAGDYLPELARRTAPTGEVAGVDADPAALAEATANISAHPLRSQVTLVQGHATELPLPPDAFDVVWCASMLHHVATPAVALGEMWRVLRPGGLVGIREGDSGASFPFLPLAPAFEARLRWAVAEAAAQQRPPAADYFDGYIGRKLPGLLRQAGFHRIRLQAFTDVDQAPLAPARALVVRRWLSDPFAARLGTVLNAEDRTRLESLLNPSSPDYLLADPDFFMTRTWLLVTAIKPGACQGAPKASGRQPDPRD